MTTVAIVEEATTPEQILACWAPMFQLRPHLKKHEFVDRVTQQQRDEGYRLLYIEAPAGGEAVAVLGFRVQNYLWSGKTLYIDDYCTHVSGQRKGYGSIIMDEAVAKAKELKCDCVSLDSGYTRNDAHRMYLNKGFKLASHHFHMSL